jgi:tRNA U38,U39,U40 pseudouridine synthase TruA
MLASWLNKFVQYGRFIKLCQVNNEFNSRSQAKSRTYVYRLGMLENGTNLWNDCQNVIKVDKALNGDPLFASTQTFSYLFDGFSSGLDRNFITELRYSIYEFL